MSLSGSKPKVPPTPDPIAMPEIEEGDAEKGMRKRKGKARTVLAGDLVPPDLGQRTLLGGR